MTAVTSAATPSFTASFPLVEAKLNPLTPPAGSVTRDGLLAPLLAIGGTPIVALVAAPGFGKTTLLAQWVARETRPVVWLIVDAFDNDPSMLLAYLAAAIDRVRPISVEAQAALGGASHRLLATAVPRLLSELHRWPSPGVIVLDDIHTLSERASLDVVATFLERLPPGFRRAIAGRREPDLPRARLRARHALR